MTVHAYLRSMLRLALFVPALAHSSAQEGGTSAKAVEVSETVMAKRLDHIVAPKLPEGAVGKCSNAMVILKVTIDENGKVRDEEFVSGFGELKDSAMTAIKQWTYKPYEQHGNAIAVHTRVSIFYLGDGESFPVYSPDGKGGVKGGNMIPLPPGCGSGPVIKRSPNYPLHLRPHPKLGQEGSIGSNLDDKRAYRTFDRPKIRMYEIPTLQTGARRG
jgi:hypothetical protein